MTEVKTIREWLNELPEPYRSRAIKNAENPYDPLLGHLADSLHEAIGSAFIWSDSPEGVGYWTAVHDGETPELPGHLNEEE